MKVDALVTALSATFDVQGDTRALEEFTRIAGEFGRARTAKTFLSSLEEAAKGQSFQAGGSSLGALQLAADRFASIANVIGTKAAQGEARVLLQIVKGWPGVTLSNLRLSSPKRVAGAKKAPAPLRNDLVQDYRRQIAELRIGSPELTALFAKLTADKKMRAIEVASLASLVAYETPPSTKRPEALTRIKQRHESYLTSAAKSDATKGSSAT